MHHMTFSTGNAANYTPGLHEEIIFDRAPTPVDLLEFLAAAAGRQATSLIKEQRFGEVIEVCAIAESLEGWEPDS